MRAACSRAREPRWDEAEAALAEAVAINRRYVLPWDEAKAHYELARTHLRRDGAGDREQARIRLATARELFERAGARRDVEKLLAQTT